MTNEDYCEIMDKSNFLIDSANPYDMKIKKALEKQIPIEPIKESMCSSNAFESWDKYYCPNCNKFLHSGARSLISKLSMSMYCCGCGQAIKWE